MNAFSSLFQTYQKDKNLKQDKGQLTFVHALDELWRVLVKPQKKSLFSKKAKPIMGLYVWGGVGRGKTMIMDLFFEAIPIDQKRRVHFNLFMLDVHNSIKILREDGKGKDPLPQIAREIAQNCRLLCFDEFQVYDIADAMVLAELFTALFREGVVVVATSNVAPDNLYKDGLQRTRFLPFIPLVKKHMTVIHLDSGIDYRQQALRDNGTYFIQEEARMRHLFEQLVAPHKAVAKTLNVKGRTLPIEKAVDGMAWLPFSELCEKPRAAADYQAVSNVYNTIFINDVPRMGYDRRNEAKRFILLIDTLYDAGRRVVINAEIEPQMLYHGDHHAFEFERTISRLLEMQGEEYLLKTEKSKIAKK